MTFTISILAFTLNFIWPAEFTLTLIQAPTAVINVLDYFFLLPFSFLFPLAFSKLNPLLGIVRRSVGSMNLVDRRLPGTIFCLILLSASLLGGTLTHSSASAMAQPDSAFVAASAPLLGPLPLGATTPPIPFLGEWKPDTGALHHQGQITHTALVNSSVVATATATASGLPTLVVIPDTGATASAVHNCDIITNLRPCDEVFGSANGEVARCVGIGDLPALALTRDGTWAHITFTNVCCVPKFKYNLLSVDQLWAEQAIDSLFADKRHLKLPESAGGLEIPFSPKIKLNSIIMYSEPQLRKHRGDNATLRTPAATPRHSRQSALLGFYGVKKTSHIYRMSTATVTALMHRRRHEGDVKLRKLCGCASDAPTSLSSARAVSCVPCAAAAIRKTTHSGHLPTPDGPGTLHVDIKGPMVESLYGYNYAAFFTEAHSRYVIVKYLKLKSEIVNATAHAIAEFDAMAGTKTDDNGNLLGPRPRIREIRSDHEGGLTSHNFDNFRAARSIHSSKSPPHDHDLNPISESIIHTINTKATAIRSDSGAPASFWPYIINHCVDIHNSSPTSVGSSSADPDISPHQRLTFHQPKIMDIATFGSRAIVLKPAPYQVKGNLSDRGWVGVFLGRAKGSIGAYFIWLPAEKKVVTSSSVTIDEEFFPWHGKEAFRPLLHVPYPTPSVDANVLGGMPSSTLTPAAPSPAVTPAAPSPATSLNSSPSKISHALVLYSGPYDRSGGLRDRLRGFGWTSITQVDNDDATGGGWAHSVFNDEFYSQLKSRAASGMYDAMVIAPPCSAYSICRFFDSYGGAGTDRGPRPIHTRQHPDGVPASDLSARELNQQQRARTLLERTAEIAIAARLSPRKTSIIFENPADRSIPGTIQFSPDYSNHGSIFQTSQFKRLEASIGPCSSCTFAQCRLGSKSQKYTTLVYTNDAAFVLDPLGGPAYKCNHSTHAKVAGGRSPDGNGWQSSGTEQYPDRMNLLIASALTCARTGDHRPIASLGSAAPTELSPTTPAPDPTVPLSVTAVPFAPAVPIDVPAVHLAHPSADVYPDDLPDPRSARPSTVASTAHAHSQPWAQQDRERRQSAGAASPDEFSLAVDTMEETVASLVYSTNYTDQPHHQVLGPWIDVPSDSLAGATRVSPGTWISDAPLDHEAQSALLSACTSCPLEVKTYHTFFDQVALRADSSGAPSTHANAIAMGGEWPASEATELGNHNRNQSWTKVTGRQLPYGRRVHKMVWVYKLKRVGTCKARLCVQGCSLVSGVDYDQVYSSALKYSSARGLFALAASKGCSVRSVDYTAAYLQGKFIDGEVVYCHMPPGYEEKDQYGNPMLLRIEKPIYGIPQAGRRLQRQIFPWMVDTMGLRQLDDSDNCVFIYDDPAGIETLVVGVYVDNLQIVHSAKLDSDGIALDPSSFYSKFLSRLQTDWEVVDEGVMDDLLGIQARYNADGSITLHQEKYIDKLAARFLPDGIPSRVQKQSLPFTKDILQHCSDAVLAWDLGKKPHPELVKPLQERLGSIMYCCTSTRPDIAFATNLLCTCMTRPTPEVIQEANQVIAYLAQNRSVGITFDRQRTDLEGYADASWEVKHSTSGWVVMWQSACMLWGSRKQHCISLSSCESEIVALSEAAKDMVYARKFVSGLDQNHLSGPSSLRTDSKSACDIAYNPENHDKTKHIERRHFYIRDMVEKHELRVPFVSTVDNIADFFTKPLNWSSFVRFRRIIMNEKTSDSDSAPSSA